MYSEKLLPFLRQIRQMLEVAAGDPELHQSLENLIRHVQQENREKNDSSALPRKKRSRKPTVSELVEAFMGAMGGDQNAVALLETFPHLVALAQRHGKARYEYLQSQGHEALSRTELQVLLKAYYDEEATPKDKHKLFNTLTNKLYQNEYSDGLVAEYQNKNGRPPR